MGQGPYIKQMGGLQTASEALDYGTGQNGRVENRLLSCSTIIAQASQRKNRHQKRGGDYRRPRTSKTFSLLSANWHEPLRARYKKSDSRIALYLR